MIKAKVIDAGVIATMFLGDHEIVHESAMLLKFDSDEDIKQAVKDGKIEVALPKPAHDGQSDGS